MLIHISDTARLQRVITDRLHKYRVRPDSNIITSKRYSVGLAYPAARGIGAIGQV